MIAETPTLEATLTRILSRGLASSEKPFVRERGISGKPEIVLPFKSRGRDLHEVRRVLYWLREDTLDSLPTPPEELKKVAAENEEELPLVFEAPKKTPAGKIISFTLFVPSRIRSSVVSEARRGGVSISKIIRFHLFSPRSRDEKLPNFRSRLVQLSVRVSEKEIAELKADARKEEMRICEYIGKRFVASYTKRRGGSK